MGKVNVDPKRGKLGESIRENLKICYNKSRFSCLPSAVNGWARHLPKKALERRIRLIRDRALDAAAHPKTGQGRQQTAIGVNALMIRQRHLCDAIVLIDFPLHALAMRARNVQNVYRRVGGPGRQGFEFRAKAEGDHQSGARDAGGDALSVQKQQSLLVLWIFATGKRPQDFYASTTMIY